MSPVLDDDRFTRVPSGRFRSRYGPLGCGALHSRKKLCFVATDPAFLIELLYGLSLRADCYAVKYGTFAREGMYLGRCFFATDEAAGELCQELKGHAKVLVSVQDDAWFESFRSDAATDGAAGVWDAWPEDESEVATVIESAFGCVDEVELIAALRAANAVAIALVAGVAPNDPERERWRLVGRGFGARLVEVSLRRARALGHDYVVVAGLPDYFSRFGFRPASEFGLRSTEPTPHFQAFELVAGALHARAGVVCRHPAVALGRDGTA